MFAREVQSSSLVWISPESVDFLKEGPRGTIVTLRSGNEVYISGDLGDVQAALARRDFHLDFLGEVERGVFEMFQREADHG